MNDPLADDEEPTIAQELVERAIQGDQGAIGALLYNASDDLLQFISRRMSNSLLQNVSAEDILQEVFAIAFRSITTFEVRANASIMSWLRTIAVNRIQDVARSQKRLKRGGGRTQIAPANDFRDESKLEIFDAFAMESDTPLRKASREEAKRIVSVALSQLPVEHREALRLQYEDGLSYQEIAERLGKTLLSIQGLIKRAKQMLRDHLGTASAYLSSR